MLVQKKNVDFFHFTPKRFVIVRESASLVQLYTEKKKNNIKSISLNDIRKRILKKKIPNSKPHQVVE